VGDRRSVLWQILRARRYVGQRVGAEQIPRKVHGSQRHETARLGFFGCPAATECEKAGRKDAPEWKCIFKHKDGSKVVSWNSDEESWQMKFYDRFIRPLPPETVLAVVDYHV